MGEVIVAVAADPPGERDKLAYRLHMVLLFTEERMREGARHIRKQLADIFPDAGPAATSLAEFPPPAPGEREQVVTAAIADEFGNMIGADMRMPEDWARRLAQAVLAALPAAAPAGGARAVSVLTEAQADAIEAELRAIEADPEASKRALRLFMQAPMPCGHAAANLLTCPTPPFGCVICNALRVGAAATPGGAE